MFVSSSSGFRIEENDFHSTLARRNAGLIIRNSGKAANDVYKNYFNQLEVACQAQGINGIRSNIFQTAYDGLTFTCNEYSTDLKNLPTS